MSGTLSVPLVPVRSDEGSETVTEPVDVGEVHAMPQAGPFFDLESVDVLPQVLTDLVGELPPEHRKVWRGYPPGCAV